MPNFQAIGGAVWEPNVHLFTFSTIRSIERESIEIAPKIRPPDFDGFTRNEVP